MKTVFVSAFLEDAIVVKTMLESAGIPAELLSDQMLGHQSFLFDRAERREGRDVPMTPKRMPRRSWRISRRTRSRK